MITQTNYFNGMQIVLSQYALEETEVRLFPESRHRSKRILKKLIKRHGGVFEKQPCAYKIGDKLFMHPQVYKVFKNKFQDNPTTIDMER